MLLKINSKTVTVHQQDTKIACNSAIRLGYIKSLKYIIYVKEVPSISVEILTLKGNKHNIEMKWINKNMR